MECLPSVVVRGSCPRPAGTSSDERPARLLCRLVKRLLSVAAALALLAIPAGASAASQPTRYSLVHGCYALSGVAGGEHIRMQATGLGSYLLYRPDSTFLTAREGGSVSPATEPSPAADWKVEPAGAGVFTLTPKSGNARLNQVHFTPADACADYPEASLDASGRPARAATEFGRV